MQIPDRAPDQVRFLGPDETGDAFKVVERWNLTDEERAAMKVEAHLFPAQEPEPFNVDAACPGCGATFITAAPVNPGARCLACVTGQPD